MSFAGKERNAIENLLRLVREESVALRADLADVAAARAAAEISLARLGEAADGMAGEGGLARRRRIAVMLATLERAEAEAREKLETAAGLALRLKAQMAQGAAPGAADAPPSFVLSAAR